MSSRQAQTLSHTQLICSGSLHKLNSPLLFHVSHPKQDKKPERTHPSYNCWRRAPRANAIHTQLILFFTMASILLPFLFLFLLRVAPTHSSPPPIAGGAAGENATTEFIRASCRATQYPNLCFRSLARYANAVQLNPVELARVAANVTLARVRSLSARVSALRTAGPLSGLSRQEAGALSDCAATLGDAADLVRQSAEELRRLDHPAEGPEVAWRVANAQTWMSAALTNEDTCDDGFERVGPGPVKADVCRRVRVAERFTSNALALVNSLVAAGPVR